jgi:hypothetical protein
VREHVDLHELDPQQLRGPQLRLDEPDPAPGGGRVPGVQVAVGAAEEMRQVLDVEPLLRPAPDRLGRPRPGLVGLVGGQPGEDRRVDLDGRFHVEVAALAGLLRHRGVRRRSSARRPA